jgi:hypothetical protein
VKMTYRRSFVRVSQSKIVVGKTMLNVTHWQYALSISGILTSMRSCSSSMQTFDEKAMLTGQEIGT